MPPALVADLDRSFTADEQTELLLGIALFHGFSKMLIALGLEPEQMDTTIVPTPTPPGRTTPGNPTADPHVELLKNRPDLAARWAEMARAVVDAAPSRAPTIYAARRRLAQLLGVAWAARLGRDDEQSDSDTGASGPLLDLAIELAELFAIDVRAITTEHRERLRAASDDTGVVQLVMALAIYDGIYRVAASTTP